MIPQKLLVYCAVSGWNQDRGEELRIPSYNVFYNLIYSWGMQTSKFLGMKITIIHSIVSFNLSFQQQRQTLEEQILFQVHLSWWLAIIAYPRTEDSSPLLLGQQFTQNATEINEKIHSTPCVAEAVYVNSKARISIFS